MSYGLVQLVNLCYFRYNEQSPTFESREGYGATGRDVHSDNHYHNDLDKLFPERLHHKKGTVSIYNFCYFSPLLAYELDQKLIKITLENSAIMLYPLFMFQGSHTSDHSSVVSSPEDSVSVTGSAVTAVEVGATLPTDQKQTNIHSKPHNWYSSLCNRWASLFGVCYI